MYCGIAQATTRDHIPPKCIFPKPRPALITVPACRPCNETCSKDDVYFRDLLVASKNLKNDANASQVRDTVARSLQRREQGGLASYIRDSFVDVNVHSPGGIYLHKGVGIRADVARLQSVLKRIVRGLFWHETGSRLPPGYRVQAQLDQFGDSVVQEFRKQFGRPSTPIRRLGDVFEYAVLPSENYPSCLWLGCFYKRVFFIGLISDNDEEPETEE